MTVALSAKALILLFFLILLLNNFEYFYVITYVSIINYEVCDLFINISDIGFSRWLNGKESSANAGDEGHMGSITGSERFLGGRNGKWQPTPVFSPGKSHRQRRLYMCLCVCVCVCVASCAKRYISIYFV